METKSMKWRGMGPDSARGEDAVWNHTRPSFEVAELLCSVPKAEHGPPGAAAATAEIKACVMVCGRARVHPRPKWNHF